MNHVTVYALLIGAGCLLALLLLALTRADLSDRAKRILLALVCEAEEAFGPGTGEIKLSAVLGRLYEQMPAAFGRLFPADTAVGWIEEAVKRMQDREKDGDET